MRVKVWSKVPLFLKDKTVPYQPSPYTSVVVKKKVAFDLSEHIPAAQKVMKMVSAVNAVPLVL